MQSLLVTCVLATLIATGMSLFCEICEGFGHTCEGPLHPCPSGFDTCGIIQSKSTRGPQIKATVKTCLPVTSCEEGLSVINLGSFGTLVNKVTCCVGEECSKVPPTLPPINTQLNGKQCPACYVMHSFTCQEEIVQCAGDEIYCFEMAGTSNLGGMTMTTIVKGCTNVDMCNDTIQGSGSFAGISVVASANCTLASGTASSIPQSIGFFLQAFTGILLVKIFS